jgi:hypothetical protein
MQVIRGGGQVIIIKYVLGGLLGGLLYGFVSFYLVTPFFRNNIVNILIFGLAGLVFGLIYSLLKIILKRKGGIVYSLFIGVLSGIGAAFVNVFISFYHLFLKPELVRDVGLRNQIYVEAAFYVLGFVIIGMTVGFINYKITKNN